jgi:SAM-dependent methyltransferase
MISNPAAERNKGPILDVLRSLLPARGVVLEVASGTGQHVEHFASHLPHLDWQPTEVDPSACAVVAARLQVTGLLNVREPLVLDAMSQNWPSLPALAAVVCINMIHIAPWEATAGLLRGASRALSPGGLLVLYGPYKRGGAHTAPSNDEFDRSLQARNPRWGVRNLEAVVELAVAQQLRLLREFAMPANNLSLAFART